MIVSCQYSGAASGQHAQEFPLGGGSLTGHPLPAGPTVGGPGASENSEDQITDIGGVPVLCTRSNSVYRCLGADCWDKVRDAWKFVGMAPLVAHPPCRLWSVYRRWRVELEPLDEAREMLLGLRCVELVRRNGGIVEHPRYSRLWGYAGLPSPARCCAEGDRLDGWTLEVEQGDFGHRSPKRTWLYIVGLRWKDLPVMPLGLGGTRNSALCSHSSRISTPRLFAEWLLAAVGKIKPGLQRALGQNMKGRNESQSNGTGRNQQNVPEKEWDRR